MTLAGSGTNGVHFSEDDQIQRGFRLRRKQFRSNVHGAVCKCPDFVFRRDGLDAAGFPHLRAVGLLKNLGS